MANTAISDIINPEVLQDQISAKFPDKLVLGNSSLVQVDPTMPMGMPGTQVKIPFWKRIGSFAGLTEGQAMSTGKISTDAEYAIIQRAGLALAVTDQAELVSKADPVGEIADQIARRAAEYIDNALVVCAQNTPNTFDQTGTNKTNTAGTMDQNAVSKALMGALGDNYGSVLAGGALIVHSKVMADLQQTAAIQNQYQSGFDTIRTGLVPTLMGLPIIVSDRVTVNVVSSVNKYQSYIIGPGALALMYQRQVMVEFDRDILALVDIISSNVHFAPHLWGWDESTATAGVGGSQKAEDAKSIHVVNIKSN